MLIPNTHLLLDTIGRGDVRKMIVIQKEISIEEGNAKKRKPFVPLSQSQGNIRLPTARKQKPMQLQRFLAQHFE